MLEIVLQVATKSASCNMALTQLDISSDMKMKFINFNTWPVYVAYNNINKQQ